MSGPGVTRFQPGDRVMGNTSGVLQDDARFGAYQKFCLVPARLTAKVGCNLPLLSARETSFSRPVAYV
jgi:NADPH:quinone reductase-like Zn-dependent oxidoreductase